MKRVVEEAIARAGLLPVLAARRSGDLDAVRAKAPAWRKADLLALGAAADIARAEGAGDVVRIHERASADVTWVEIAPGESELDLLRAVAVARLASAPSARVGVDWSRCGLELAQVALGFGASDLRGPITKKSGLPVLDGETLKVKGQGMVELRAIKKREIAALVGHAGRRAVFVDDLGAPHALEEHAPA
ncbi:MAG: hypothetical protein KF819_39470 [Labilithrix sp.]|nr:hypothetical protein [Labilithrix sp.]